MPREAPKTFTHLLRLRNLRLIGAFPISCLCVFCGLL